MQNDMVKITTEEYAVLCGERQQLMTVRDYLERCAQNSNNSVSINIVSIMAGNDDEVIELQNERKKAQQEAKKVTAGGEKNDKMQ